MCADAEDPNQKLVTKRDWPGGRERNCSCGGLWIRRTGRKQDKCCGRTPGARPKLQTKRTRKSNGGGGL